MRTDTLPGRPTARARAAALAGLLLAPAAAMAQTSPWYVAASQSFTHDSNLLRLATGQDTPAGYSRDDDIRSTALLAGLDQPIGRQRLSGNLTLRDNRYQGNPRFNNTSYNALLGLDWSTIERLSGSLQASANRALQSFSTDLFTTERSTNIETTETLNGSLALGLVTEYSLVANGGHLRVHNSLTDPGIRSRDFYQDNGELGLRWKPSSTATFGLALGATRGRYPKFSTLATGEYQADRFRRDDVVLVASLKPSGASNVDLRLANGRTTYDLNQKRNFSGVTGLLAWGWQATGKLRLNASFNRDTGQDSYATRTVVSNQPTTADYSRLTKLVKLQAYYEWSAKVGFNAGASYSNRDLVRTINDPLIPTDATGRDRTQVLTAGARWTPRRYAMIGCDGSFERRTGRGELTSDMSAKTLTCFGQITLQ